MNIIPNPGASQSGKHVPAGSFESQIKNPTASNTADAPGPSITSLTDIRSALKTSSITHDKIDYPSLPASEVEIFDGIESTLAKLGSMEPKTVLMDMGAILGLMFQFLKELQATGRISRKADSIDKINHSLSAAEQTMAAGESRYKSAMLSSALKIACGVIQITASAVSLGCSLAAAKAQGAGNKADAIKWGGYAEFFNSLSKGISSIIEGVGARYTADHDLDATQAEAQKAIYDALAQAADSKSNEASEIFSMAMELMRKVLEVLQNQIDGARNLNSKITSNMV